MGESLYDLVMAVVKQGRGQPFTLFAPGGLGEELANRMRYAKRVPGTKVGFAYEQSGHFESIAHLRRQAERDAAEARAVATEYSTTQAIGFSRGARALVGVLADGPAPFQRLALILPPGGAAAGRYSAWLESTPAARGELADVAVLVIGNRGDQGHPSRVAEAWANQLGAHVEVLPSRAVYTDVDRVAALLADFFS